MASIINASSSGSGGIVQTADASGVLQLQSNGTVSVTVDTSANVGIGTASPSTRLDVTTGTGGTQNIATLRTANVQIKIGTTDIGNGEAYYNVFPTSNSSAAGAHIWQGGGTNLMKLQNTGIFQFNSGYGSVANAYGVRAWAQFTGGVGTGIGLTGGQNVSSFSRNSSSNYSLFYTTAMPDGQYAASCQQETGSFTLDNIMVAYNYYTASLNMIAINGGGQSDFRTGSAIIVR